MNEGTSCSGEQRLGGALRLEVGRCGYSEDIDSKIADLAEDEASNGLRRRLLLGRFWLSARGVWGPHGDRLAWLLTGTILLSVLLYLAAFYGMNVWNRAIFDALERRDGGTVLYLSLIYVPLLVDWALNGRADTHQICPYASSGSRSNLPSAERKSKAMFCPSM